MMNRSNIVVIWITALLLMSSGFVFAKTYKPNMISSTQPLLTLTKVQTFKSRAEFEFNYQAKEEDKRIGVYPPGHDLAFFITDIKKAKKYHLRDVKNIALIPNETLVKAGESHAFTLVFPRIKLTRFHLIEGAQQLLDGLAWHFSNVRLK